MKYLSILVSKFSIFILEKIGRGSAMPGTIARKIDKNTLKKIEHPKIVIAVTGSSGKTTTANMIYDILKNNGYKVANNSRGSNLLDGVTSLFVKYCSLTGKNKLDAIVLEVDERYTGQVFNFVKPTHVVLTNITRDQPPRHGDYKTVYNVIKNAIPKESTLIFNADDPIISNLALGHTGKKVYYGMSKNKDSQDTLLSNCLDMVYCPKCFHKLKYDYVHFSNVGLYHCSNCDFKRHDLDYEITGFEKDKIIINNKYIINTNYQMLYYFYNIIASFSCSSELGIESEKIVQSLNNFKLINYRYNEIKLDDRTIEFISAKNENAISYNQAMNYIRNKGEVKTIVFGFEYISKRYKYQDISWLYDIDFEFISNVDKFVCVGPFAYDIASRISVTDISKENIIVIKEIDKLTNVLKNTKGNIYAILNMGNESKFIESISKLK